MGWSCRVWDTLWLQGGCGTWQGPQGMRGSGTKSPVSAVASWENRQNGSKRWEKGKCEGEKVVPL